MQPQVFVLPFLSKNFPSVKVSKIAMKHRKLVPILETNQTLNSDPSCPYGCDPYSDFYFSPPPPPPPPAAKHREHVSPYIIIIVTFLGSVFLLLSYYAIMVKYRSRFRRSSDGPDEEFLDGNPGPIIDHHIWYINTIGLEPAVINSITVVKYNKCDSVIEGTDCSVCLNEFLEDETLRLLPKCNHAFHIPCIDTWLRSHTNCPLCRAGIFSNTQNLVLASTDQISRNLDSTESTQMENFQDSSESEGIQVGEGEVCENREETGDAIDFQQTENERKEKDENGLVIENMKQPMRRSVSMDRAAEITVGVGKLGGIKPEGSSVNTIMDSSSILKSLDNGPVSMKRSFSYGGRSVFSRH